MAGEPNDPTFAAFVGRVLVVDDEPELRRLFRRTLVRAGHEVVLAVDGTAALALVRERTFDVVISDIRMPGLDGLDLLEILQREHPAIPVVLVSGSPDLERASSAYGALDYLVKPVSFEDLRNVVAFAVEIRRRGLNTVPERSGPRASNGRLRVAAPLSEVEARIGAGNRERVR